MSIVTQHKPPTKQTQTMRKLIVIPVFLLFANVLFAQQTFEWGVKAGGEGTDIVNDIVSIEDDIYVAGSFRGSIRSGGENAAGVNGNDIYLLRLNSKGNARWLHSLSGQGLNSASCLAVADQQILMGGTISETVKQNKQQFEGDGKAVFISSWNEQGKIQWLTRMEYTGHATLDVLEVLSDGTLLAGGLFQGKMDIGEETLSSPKSKRAWVAVFSPDGKPQEANLSFGEGHHRFVSATSDKEGNRYYLFSVSGHFSMEKDSLTMFPKTAEGGLIVCKTGSDGDMKWNKLISGTGYVEGLKVVCADNNEIIVCSNYNKELQAGETRLSTSSQLESAILSYNQDGTLVWTKTISSPVKARVMDMRTTGNGDLLVAGYFRQSYVFNDEPFFSESSRGNLFLLQMDQKGELVWHDEPGEDAVSFCKAFTLDKTGNIVLAGGFRDEFSLQGNKLKAAGKEDVFIAKYFNCEQKEVRITGMEPLCEGKEINLSVSGAYKTFIWNGNQWGENNYLVKNPGTYSVTAYDAKGCSASDTVKIELAAEMGLGLPEEIELSSGDKTILNATAGFVSYQWSDEYEGAEHEIFYNPELDSTVLYLVAESFEECQAKDSVKLYFKHEKSGSINGVAYQKLSVWPNPVETELSWSVTLPEPGEVTITLTDSKSVTISSKVIKRYIPGSVQTLNMAGLTSGNYLLSIKVGETVYTRKIVKQ